MRDRRSGPLIMHISTRIARCPRCGQQVSMPASPPGTLADDNELVHDCNSSFIAEQDYDRHWTGLGTWEKVYHGRWSKTIKNPRLTDKEL